MAAGTVSFDECYQTVPAVKKPQNLSSFWQKAILNLKKLPVEPQQKIVIKRSIARESITEISFQSAGMTIIHGVLSIPRRRGRQPVIVHFPDYHEQNRDLLELGNHSKVLLENGIAYLSLKLRGAVDFSGQKSALAKQTTPGTKDSGQVSLPTRFLDSGIEYAEKSFAVNCYLDAVRAIDYLRLSKGIDTSRIGLLGRGFGAAMALFAASYKQESIRAMALERPSPVYFDEWLDTAESQMADEFRMLANKKSGGQASRTASKKSAAGRKKKPAKADEYLSMIEPLNWASGLSLPVLVSASMEDRNHPPKAVFGLYNTLGGEDKAMQLLTDETLDPKASNERQGSIQFLIQALSE